jgi:polysaccharide export outer membrane protein
MFNKHEAIAGLILTVVVGVLAWGCSTSSGTVKTEALIANVMRDETRDNLALYSRLLAMATTETSLRDYTFGPGDLLEISVFDIAELSKIKTRVASEGLITLPLVGPVEAGGKTAMELEEALKTALSSKYIRNPQVSVFLLEYHSQKISVLGAVKKPGVFEVSGPRTLVDMLALAEGLTEQSDQVVYLIRKVAKSTAAASAGPRQQAASDGKPPQEAFVQINLDELLVSGNDQLNVRLQAGDVVHVPKAGSFFVGGAVQKPGSYVLKGKGTTVDQAIIEAGGVNHVAALEEVRIFREHGGQRKEIIEVNLNEIEQGKKGPVVMKNDVILVSKDGVKAFWFGFLDFIRVGVGKTF